jgi:hypothetical protein
MGHDIAGQRDKIFESIEQMIHNVEEVCDYYSLIL